MIYRIDEDLAREQAQWFVFGLILFAATIIAAARLPRARALPLHDRGRGHRRCCCCRACPASAAGQRRVPRRRLRAAVVPAGRVREDRDHHLPGQLPARHAPAAGHRRAAVPRHHDPAAEALRPAAARLGRGDGDAVLHPGPRLVADVLRRLPGGPLRGDEPLLVRRVGLRAVRLRRRGSSTTSARRSRTGSTPGSTRSGPLYDKAGGSYQLAQSLFAQADGGLFGAGLRPVAAHGRHGRRQDRSCCRRRRPTSSTRSSPTSSGCSARRR